MANAKKVENDDIMFQIGKIRQQYYDLKLFQKLKGV